MTLPEMHREMARLIRQRDEWNILGMSNWKSDADLAGRIADLDDAIWIAEHPEDYGEPVKMAEAA